jgi:hypothetical protein
LAPVAGEGGGEERRGGDGRSHWSGGVSRRGRRWMASGRVGFTEKPLAFRFREARLCQWSG